MRIVQITDPHLDSGGENPFGVDVRDHFRRSLAECRRLQPDYLVISGDLCREQGERPTYEWIKEQLAVLDCPSFLLAGNHDAVALMEEVFCLQHQVKYGELYYQQQLADQTCLFLDTSTGRVSEPQLQWLRLCLQQLAQPLVLFMHHPPLRAGVPHMDKKYSLHNYEEVLGVLCDHPFPLTIFCGHYHVDKTIHYRNLGVHITPSTYFQIDQFQPEFEVDHLRPGLRVIDFVQQQIRTTTRYF